jgi:hypothetical protein
MKVEQFVMAYRGNHDEIKALLPKGFESLRPVLRINAEILTDSKAAEQGATYYYIELNTPVAHAGKRGWLNLGNWDSMSTNISVSRETRSVSDGYFKTDDGELVNRRESTEFEFDLLSLVHTGTGKEGGCPAENDNDGCFYMDGDEEEFRSAEKVTERKEYTDCTFKWNVSEDLPPIPLFRAMAIECEEILGAYAVTFERAESELKIFK